MLLYREFEFSYRLGDAFKIEFNLLLILSGIIDVLSSF